VVSTGCSQIKKKSWFSYIYISALTDGKKGIKDRTLGRHGTEKNGSMTQTNKKKHSTGNIAGQQL
jgi:hypothetical protein